MLKFSYLGVVLLAVLLGATSCTKQSKASVEVAKQKLDDKFAEIVGRGQVALQMYRDRHAEIKKQVVMIKAAKKRSERMIKRKQAELAAIPPEQVQKRQLVQSSIDHYEKHSDMLSTREKEGIKALKKSFEHYELIKMQIELIEEQTESAKAMGSFETALDPGATSKEVDRLIGMMEKDLDIAEAQFEVGELDFDL